MHLDAHLMTVLVVQLGFETTMAEELANMNTRMQKSNKLNEFLIFEWWFNSIWFLIYSHSWINYPSLLRRIWIK
jgi:hypothetical protein